MENLTSKVANIENDLHEHRRQLQTFEINAKASIGGEVQDMQAALTDGDNKILYVSSDMQSCLRQIEDDHSDPTSTLHLAPQMTWLSTRLGEIASDFETAQSRAETAIYCVNDYTYKVLDVEQEVEASRSQLTEAEADGKILAREAQEELSLSERLLAATQLKITGKEREISTKTSEANAKRQRKTQLDRDIADKNRRIREVETKVEKKKDRAAISGVSSFLALRFFKPLTVSLGLRNAWNSPGTRHSWSILGTNCRCRRSSRVSNLVSHLQTPD
jgi:chromosome segregation ATPase